MGKPGFNNAKPQVGEQRKQGNYGDWYTSSPDTRVVYNRLETSDNQAVVVTSADAWRIFVRTVFLVCLLILSMLLTFLIWAYDGEALFATKSLLQARQHPNSNASNKLIGSNTTTTTPTPTTTPTDSDSVEWIYPNDCPNLDSLTITSTLSSGSTWTVEYDPTSEFYVDLNPPVLKLSLKDIVNSSCSCRKDFALILTLDDEEEISGWDWFKLCGPRILFFRYDRRLSENDTKRLKSYLPNADYFPLKGILKVGEGGETPLDGFVKTRKMIMRNVEVSGYTTTQIMGDLLDWFPYVENLTIQGSSICSGFKQTPRRESGCQKKLAWDHLKTLRIIEVGDCSGLFEFINSCWKMPKIEVLTVKKSQLNDVVAYNIVEIVHRYKINLDMSDNVCFENSMLHEASLCDK